jgi:prolipoprotein diacylglyceryltransferase
VILSMVKLTSNICSITLIHFKLDKLVCPVIGKLIFFQFHEHNCAGEGHLCMYYVIFYKIMRFYVLFFKILTQKEVGGMYDKCIDDRDL